MLMRSSVRRHAGGWSATSGTVKSVAACWTACWRCWMPCIASRHRSPSPAHLGREAQTLDHEFEQALERALDELPREGRNAVVLRDIEGLSTREAAEIVVVREAAFKSRLHRARMQLRALLEPYLMLEEG